MKKLFLFSVFLFFVLTGWSKEVTKQQAKEVAIHFIQTHSHNVVDVKNIQTIGDKQNAYYVINFIPQGWAIVAADDVVMPIIGYSYTGHIEMNSLPDNMRYFLNDYEKQILKTIEVETKQHPYWRQPQGYQTRAISQQIAPLIKVLWNQDKPYNAYCPRKEALVGCVAVAMAQAMSVQRYPARPVGEIRYANTNFGVMYINYTNEMAYNWNDILSGVRNYDEAARLMYHTGMSVRMNYGIDGSGIPSNEPHRIADAFKKNFSYPASVETVWRDQYNDDWKQLLINELNAGRAIVYNAIDTKQKAGHSFNVDGYDGDGRFHVNWGWGGYGNGNFSVDYLSDAAMKMNYDANHVIIIGIGSPDQVLKSISLSHNRIEENLPIGSVVGSILINDGEIKPTYNISVHGTYDERTGRYKNVPFKIENGMLKTTEVLRTTTPQWDMEITVEDQESGSSLTQGFHVMVDPWKSLEKTTSLKFDRQTRTLMLITKHNVAYSIISSNGVILQKGNLSPLPQLQINVNTLPAGVNAIELKCADESKRFQIISTQN